MTFRPKPPRRGAFLSELLVVIAFAGVMMAATTKLIVLMFHTERAARERHHAMMSVERLLDQFQRDVQAAARQLPPLAQAPPSLVRLQMARSGDVVEYRLRGSYVDRTVLQANKVAARESFQLAETARVEVRGDGREPTRLTLVVRNVPLAGSEHAGEQIHVHAMLGRDARFAAADREKQP